MAPSMRTMAIYSGQVQFSMGPHSMAGNPGFTNAGAGDFHLAAGSPAVDTACERGLWRRL